MAIETKERRVTYVTYVTEKMLEYLKIGARTVFYVLKRRSEKRRDIDTEEVMIGWIWLHRFQVLVLENSGHLRTCRLGVTT